MSRRALAFTNSHRSCPSNEQPVRLHRAYSLVVHTRHFPTSPATPAAPHRPARVTLATNARANKDRLAQGAQEKEAKRDFFIDLLHSAATKRDAKAYLARFNKPQGRPPPHPSAEQTRSERYDHASIWLSKPAVNLGSLFGFTHAAGHKPVFTQDKEPARHNEEAVTTLHVALVKLSRPQTIDDGTLQSIAQTLTQLSRLGMGCCVVADTGVQTRHQNIEQADRVAAAFDALPGPGALRLDNLVGVSTLRDTRLPLRVLHRKLLLAPLRRGQIPVIAPIAYTDDTQMAVHVPSNDLVLALTRELAGLNLRPRTDEDPATTARTFKLQQKETSLDRLIILDPLGGIPHPDQLLATHTFINMEQEYGDIRNDILSKLNEDLQSTYDRRTCHAISSGVSGTPSISCPETRPVEHSAEPSKDPETAQGHLDNLSLLQETLAYLPPSSSGILTTPSEAANSANLSERTAHVSGVRTRRQKNPLIHNLLTDKPAFSSSLPPGRLGAMGVTESASLTTGSTFVKKGMPLTILPDPRLRSWTADNHGDPRLTLDDPRIDLPRLVHLIEDSFDRKLDVEDYLRRVNQRIAGLIVAGEYEGGALLTWETPTGVPDDMASANLARKVPYLDKFAVLKRSQGAGGVADIVFNAMVRACFPDGVCWRSRQDNPVNKWYFERARGTWKIPSTQWTMFWTTDGIVEDGQTFRDYESVCHGVQPSWADNKQVLD